jgi:hypothetical protein
MAKMVFPSDSEHHAVYGMNGSGKTVFALWCLSMRSFDKMPWIIIDFKRDEMIAKIPRLEEIGIDDNPPKRKGLYVVRPLPSDADDGIVTEFLMKVWARERTGLFLDEGYMIKPTDRGLKAVLTQGRSKHIPVIALSQRPSWISPFIHSETSFKSVFFLQMPQDVQRVQEWLPPGVEPRDLPPHHSYYYAVKTRQIARLSACPDENAILQKFDDKFVRRWYI